MRAIAQHGFLLLSGILALSSLTIVLKYHFNTIPPLLLSKMQDEQDPKSHDPKIHLFISITKDYAMSNKRFCRVLESAVVNGWVPNVLNWESDHPEFNKNSVYGLKKLLSSPSHTQDISDHDVILKMDGSDGWLQLSPETMLQRYKEYGGEIVVGAESPIFPAPPYGDRYPREDGFLESPLPYGVYADDEEANDNENVRPKYACAGTWMGHPGPIRSLLDDWSEILLDPEYLPGWNDDQGALNLLLSEGKVVVDYLSRLFWTSNADEPGLTWINTASHPDSPAARHDDAMAAMLDDSALVHDRDDTPWHLYPPLAHHVTTGQVPVILHFNWWGRKGQLEEFWENHWWDSGRERFKGIVQHRLDKAVVRFAMDNGYRTERFWDVCGMLNED